MAGGVSISVNSNYCRDRELTGAYPVPCKKDTGYVFVVGRYVRNMFYIDEETASGVPCIIIKNFSAGLEKT